MTDLSSVRRSNRSLWIWSLILTLAIELVTCVFRFGLQLESTRDTASTIGRLTCGVRVHHGYIGGLLILAACIWWDRIPRGSFWLLAVGLGLFFSDMIHHFVVLWWFTGDPQFDLLYR